MKSLKSKNSVISNKFKRKFTDKRILIIDLETSGLPKRKQRDFKNPHNEYYHPKKIKYYDTSRIVQFAWCIVDMQDTKIYTEDDVKSYLVKVDFEIPEVSTNIHGITNKMCDEHGLDIKKILLELEKDLDNSDIFLAHNALFDFNILSSELFRIKEKLFLKKLNKIMSKGNLCCSMKLMRLFIGCFKNPSLKQSYKYCFGCEPKNQHNAKFDVLALVEIIKGKK